MRDGILNTMNHEVARQYCEEILAVLEKCGESLPGSIIPTKSNTFECKIKVLELCVVALSEYMADEHFPVTIQLHDKVSFTGNTWLAV